MLNAETPPDHYMGPNLVQVSNSTRVAAFTVTQLFLLWWKCFLFAEKFDLASYTGVDKSKIVGMLSVNSLILKSHQIVYIYVLLNSQNC